MGFYSFHSLKIQTLNIRFQSREGVLYQVINLVLYYRVIGVKVPLVYLILNSNTWWVKDHGFTLLGVLNRSTPCISVRTRSNYNGNWIQYPYWLWELNTTHNQRWNWYWVIMRTLCSYNVIKFPYYWHLSEDLRCENESPDFYLVKINIVSLITSKTLNLQLTKSVSIKHLFLPSTT